MAIVAELERRDVKCWIAPRDVNPGRPFDDEIADAIDASQAMLLIFSERCNEREYIRREVTVAGESHKTIIQLRIENAQPKRGLRVRLADLHWVDGFTSRERAIDELVKTFRPPKDEDVLDPAAGQKVLAAGVEKLAINHQQDQQPERRQIRAKIILGTGRPFETVAPSGKNKNRTVRAKIENNTDIEISNGTVRILNLDPSQKEHRNFFLKGDMTIGPRRYTFVDIAYYSEGTSEAPPAPSMRLCVPIPGGFTFDFLPGTLSLSPHTFQLQFSTLEDHVLDEVYCRLSVDQNHVLHLEGRLRKANNAKQHCR